MQDNNSFLPVNWVDGMKINRTHFLIQEQAFAWQTARAAGSLLNPMNYGLLPSSGATPLKLFVSIDHQQQVQVKSLRGVAPLEGNSP